MDANPSPSPLPDTVADRDALFRETPLETAERCVLGTAWALKPQRIGALPALSRLWLRDRITPAGGLPDPERTVHSGGLCGIAHDLSPDTLIEAYKRGLFTFAHFGPSKWFSPPERCVLFFNEMHVGKNVRRMARQGKYKVTFDSAFEHVVKACAERRPGKWHVTWITPHVMHAYAALYDAGHAHSFEVWNEQGQLAGGGYGVSIGGVFYTESLFSRESEASKLGLAILNGHLSAWGFAINDAKAFSPNLGSMGFRNIDRRDFLDILGWATQRPGKPGRWQVDASLALGDLKPAKPAKSAQAA